MYHKEELFKKILAWKLVSIISTTVITWIHIGSIIKSAYFALVLHTCLTILFYLFSFIWDKKEEDS